MQTFARFSSAALIAVFVPVTSGVLAVACGSEPVGVEECRRIESARCTASTACADVTEAEATYCVSFYRDQCLHGFVNKAADYSDATITACVSAIQAVEACARTGVMNMAGCSSATLVAGVDPATTLLCTIIKRTPEVLTACAFLTPNPAASSSSSSSSSSASSSSGSDVDAGADGGDGG